jgi:hypothetical protein
MTGGSGSFSKTVNPAPVWIDILTYGITCLKSKTMRSENGREDGTLMISRFIVQRLLNIKSTFFRMLADRCSNWRGGDFITDS